MRGRFILLLAAMLSCVSCLTDNTVSETPQAAITSFTIGYYNVRFHDINYHRRDTVVNVREGGVMYPMTIDQLNNRIYNADSMAYGSDLKKVTSSVYGTGTIGYIYDDEPDLLHFWSAYDSIDFTRGLKFMVISSDGTFARSYDVTVNVRKVFPDSLLWRADDTGNFPVLTGIGSVVRNDSIFCFGTDTLGVPSVSVRSITAGSWNGANNLTGITEDGWNHRVTVCNGTFYTVCAGSLYGSQDGISWNSVRSGVSGLMNSADDYGQLWAISQDSNIIRTEDMTEWTTVQKVPANFPDSASVLFSYPLATNSNLSRTVLVGLSDDSVSASIWSIISGDTVWTNVDTPADKKISLPAADYLSVIRYDGSLFGLGQGLDGFRQSLDNGITWYYCDSYAEDESSWNRYMQLPAALKGSDCGFAAVTDSNGFIWIMTDDGQVWRGAITRLRKN